MATATDVLRHEHEAIGKMLAFTESLADRLEWGEEVFPSVLDDVLEFFCLYVDLCHHAKEEELLFPLLEKKGLPRLGGPLGEMFVEHDEARLQIKVMVDATKSYRAGREEAGAAWAMAARRYATLLHDHVGTEDHKLFVEAERTLTAEEQARLAASFEKLEIEKIGADTHQRLQAKMDKLLAEHAP